ncbi:MAG: isoprenylcysteine carboxylmethyltransferase family protein [Eubacterium sp.]
MKIQTLGFAALAMVQKLLSLTCFLIAAGTLTYLRGWLYFIPYLLITAVTLFILLHRNPNALGFPEKDAPKGTGLDITLRNICSPLAFFGIYIAAGLDVRFHLTHDQTWLVAVGIILSLITNSLMSWALLYNPYYESDSPMLKESHPTVCTKGPYALVRHPGYSFMAFWALSPALSYGIITTVVATVIIILLILRIYFEDRALMHSFSGYPDYAKKVRYRMIPFIW